MIRRNAIGLGALTGVALASAKALAAEPHETGKPVMEPQDSWLDQGGKRHRIVFDTMSVGGLGLGMNSAKNFFDANQSAYGIRANEISVVVILRHLSTALAFNDAVWAEHGSVLGGKAGLSDPRSKAAPTANLFAAPIAGAELPNWNVTLGQLAGLGTRFAVCEIAASNLAKAVAGKYGGDPAAILKAMEANLVPNSVMVPAGIIAVNRAQEHGYTFSFCG